MGQRILGLDPGTNSLGWAVVDKQDDGIYTLIRKGVLRFDAGASIDDKNETPAAARRKARGLRRLFYRRRLRKIELLIVLVEYNLCPYISMEDLEQWRYKKIYPMITEFLEWQKTSDKAGELKNPYLYRYQCLTEQLDLTKQEDRYVLGRALYHLAQRRGFLSNRKAEMNEKPGKVSGDTLNSDNDTGKASKSDETETGKIKKGIKELEHDMKDAGCCFLGEYFYLLYTGVLNPNLVRLRTRQTSRKMYLDEFNAICDKQGIDEVDSGLRKKLHDAIFFQRKLKSQKYTMGNCTFEKNCTRCYASHPEFEEFRMLAFLNNVKVKKHGYDFDFRQLTESERFLAIDNILSRKSKGKFGEIAKAIAGRNNYCSVKDDETEKGKKVYEFNYDMDTEVPNCPFTFVMRKIFGGENWREHIAEIYTGMVTTKGRTKTVQQVVDDIWHVAVDFDDTDRLFKFAKDKLQMSDEKATEFSGVKVSGEVASLSLRAVRNILPFLRKGLIYPYAVFMAKVPRLLGDRYTSEMEAELIDGIINCEKKDIQSYLAETIHNLTGQCQHKVIAQLYHPSYTEIYPKVQVPKDKVPQLGSPQTRSFRNPTAMKALYQIRYIVNALLAEGIIDQSTHVHIEYPRALNNPAQRAGLQDFNKWMESKKDEAVKIIEEYKKEHNLSFSADDDMIFRVKLWLEQGMCDIYDGQPMGLEFVIKGECDIDHIVPRSMHGDDSQMNKVLTSRHNNQQVKKNQLPCCFPDYQNIKDNYAYKYYYKPYDDLVKKIKSKHPTDFNGKKAKYCDMLKRDYYKGKWMRFTTTKEPDGFSMWQGPGNATITRYLGMYLQSFFYDPGNSKKKQVWTVKSPVTAMLRKMWGLQEEWSEKDRDNHCHHAKDAIVVACAGHTEMNHLSEWMKSQETGYPYRFPLPWASFVEDMNVLEENTVVYYRTKSNLDAYTKRRLRNMEKQYGSKKELFATGVGVRGSLYKGTFYSRIMLDGQKQTLKRESLEYFKSHRKDIDRIVDGKVREAVRRWVNAGGEGPLYRDDDGMILIRGARIKSIVKPSEVKPCRDVSQKEYKRSFLSRNDGNFCCVLYNDKDTKERYLAMSNIYVAGWMKENKGRINMEKLIPSTNANGEPLFAVLEKGTHVIFHSGDKQEVRLWSQEELVARLFYITKYDIKGKIGCRFHQCGKELKEIKIGTNFDSVGNKTVTVLQDTYFSKALIEGYDFSITPLGEIRLKF